jgi:Sec-independent protein translocase protein TatA
MNILGIGLWEIILILGLAFVILGPQDMATLGRKAGVTIRKWIASEEFKEIKRTQDALTSLPSKLISEAGLDKNMISPWANPEVEPKKGDIRTEKPSREETPPGIERQEVDAALDAWANPYETAEAKRKAISADLRQSMSRMSQSKQESHDDSTDSDSPPLNPTA